MGAEPGRVFIVGAGIAGLTCAIALARAGFEVRLLERSARLDEVGAGLQLSPNATRILDELGVLARLAPVAVRPERIAIRKAATLRELTCVPLGAGAESRWGAPYLTVHRADLQSALLAQASEHAGLEILTGAEVRKATPHANGVTLAVEQAGSVREERSRLVVGADGVWSTLRNGDTGAGASRDTGYIAWRAVAQMPRGGVVGRDEVTAFLHPGFHLVAYPVRGGRATNLIAVTRGDARLGWSNEASAEALSEAMAGTAPALRALVAEAEDWTTWPLHEAPTGLPWTYPSGMVLIGDAAHAMTPYAAQGAAMAIEDAALLAALAVRSPGEVGKLLAAYERLRRPRVRRVAARGAINRFTWHASGPVALVRDAVMRVRPTASNASDLDWLYGWTVEDDLKQLG